MTRPSGARCSSVGSISASQARRSTSKTSPSRFDAVSSGPKSRKLRGLPRDDVAEKAAEHPRRLAAARARLVDLDGVVAEVRQHEVAQQLAPVRVRVGAHALSPLGRERAQLGPRARPPRRRAPPAGSSAATPPAARRCSGFSRASAIGHLVRAPGALDRQAVDLLRPGPALRRAQDDHRPRGARPPARAAAGPPRSRRAPRRARRRSARARPAVLAVEDVTRIGRGRSPRAARRARARGCARARSGSRSCSRSGAGPAAPRRRSRGFEELVRVPAGRERPGLCLAVADHAAHDQVRVVERRAEGMRERVAELAALVDRARRLRRRVARDPARERELPEELAAARPRRASRASSARCRCLRGRRWRRPPGPPWPGPGDRDRVEISGADRAVHVGPDQVQPRHGAEVPEQAGLDVLGAAAARAGAGCRAGRSDRPRGSSQRASTRRAVRRSALTRS